MRTYLIFSKGGNGVFLASRIERDGHRAVVYINDVDKRCVGDGIVEKASIKDQILDIEGSLDMHALSSLLSQTNPDCVVFSEMGKGVGRVMEAVQKERPAVGGGVWGEIVERDGEYNVKIMQLCGISTSNIPTDGVELTTELWFNGRECVNVSHAMEEKAFMEGGIGPRTEGMGSVVWNGRRTSRLYVEGIGKLEDTLCRVGYKGSIGLDTVVTQDKVYGCRITYGFKSTLYPFSELLKDGLSDLLYGIATGVVREVGVREGCGMGVAIAILPFPLKGENGGVGKDVYIDGMDGGNAKHIWLEDVYKNGNQYMCCGKSGMLGTITARGDTPGENPLREAKRRCYRTLSNLMVPDLMYRRDIGERVQEDKSQLERWGWLP